MVLMEQRVHLEWHAAYLGDPLSSTESAAVRATQYSIDAEPAHLRRDRLCLRAAEVAQVAVDHARAADVRERLGVADDVKKHECRVYPAREPRCYAASRVSD